MRGWRVVDNTQVVLGPIWQERENERKHLKSLVETVQEKLTALQDSADEKAETIKHTTKTIENIQERNHRLSTENESLKQELLLTQSNLERTQTELAEVLAATKVERDNYQNSCLQLQNIRDELEDAKHVTASSVQNEKLVREELNNVYEKLRMKSNIFEQQEVENLNMTNYIKKLEEERESDQKRITYLLRKIDTLFHKLTIARSEKAKKEEKKEPKEVTDRASIQKLSSENSKLVREKKRLEAEIQKLQKKLTKQTSAITDLKIAFRNTKLARDLLRKRLNGNKPEVVTVPQAKKTGKAG